jgi:tRNA(Ile)-lysidine synthase
MPISPEQFILAMQKFDTGDSCPKIAVAVSGGGDSLALTFLLQRWVSDRGGALLALTVDHRLRENSTLEAEALHTLLSRHQINHEILTWQGDKPATHLQERARAERYRLLLNACQTCGYTTLALAHNLEDQMETFWMRLAHGSGLDGLAGMAKSRTSGGINIIRPVLDFTREQLRATCRDFNIDWAEDPSNSNPKFLRVRLRDFETALAAEGLSPQRLSLTLQKLEDAREALEYMANQSFAQSVSAQPEGYFSLDKTVWQNFPRDIQRRVLALILQKLSPTEYPLGFEAIEQTRLEILNPDFTGKTLSACEIFSRKTDTIIFCRELATAQDRLPLQNGILWDNRFQLSGFAGESLTVGLLGETGLCLVRKEPHRNFPLPAKLGRLLPALWLENALMAVPQLDYYHPDASESLRQGKITCIL